MAMTPKQRKEIRAKAEAAAKARKDARLGIKPAKAGKKKGRR